MKRRVHAIFIGGEPTALCGAVLAAARKLNVVLLRLPETDAPAAEILRNYTRLHWGLHDPGTARGNAVLQREWGRRMLEFAGMMRQLRTAPARPAIYGVEASAAVEFESHARELMLSIQGPPRLGAATALDAVRPVFSLEYHYYGIDEILFDAAELMRDLRLQARGMGNVETLECLGPVRLVHGEDRLLRVRVGRTEFSAPVIVVGDDPMSTAVLDAAGIPHGLKSVLAPLLVIPGTHGITAPVYVDRSTGLTIACHQPSARIPEGCLVVGQEPPPGSPSRGAIMELLPPPLQSAALERGRWTASRRTVWTEEQRTSPVVRFEEFPQLLAAVTPDPTLSFYTAAQVVDALEALLGRGVPEVEEVDLETASMRPWTAEIANHYEAVYRTFDERLLIPA